MSECTSLRPLQCQIILVKRSFPEENKIFKLFWLLLGWGFENGSLVGKSKTNSEISGSQA
jgi:hypothetical protein